MDKQLDKLKKIGFTLAGEWKTDGEGIDCDLNELANSQNVLYAFVVDGDVAYVGKTIQQLRKRMVGYRNPAPTQSTNINNNDRIRRCLSDGQSVEIHVLPDNGLLHYGDFHVNLAAGLEDSVVLQLTPPWNGGKKESGMQPPNAVEKD